MKHAFIMNCHNNLRQAARTTELLRRYWSEKSEIFFYYDGPRDADKEYFEAVRANCDLTLVGPYEPSKCQSIFNAVNILINAAAEREVDIISFLHEDMIPLYKIQFYAFIDRFHQSKKIISYSKLWPTLDYIDFCNIHVSVKDALDKKLFPLSIIIDNYNFNEAQTTLSFFSTCKNWREYCYPMWAMVWPITNSADLKEPRPTFYLPEADKAGHDVNGHFVFHNYIPESTVIHVNDSYFWNHYEALSDIGPRSSMPPFIPP